LSHCPPLVPSKSNTRQQCAEARLHVGPCCAAAPVTAAGVVTAEPSSVAERRRRCNPSEVWPSSRRSPSSWPWRMSGRRPRRSSLCPRPLSALRTSVQLVGRTSGVQATSGHAMRVIRVSGQTGVRCPRPLRPRCPHRAGSRTSVPRGRPRLAHRVRRVAVVCERLGRRCPNRAWREGIVDLGRARLARGSTAHLDRRFAFAQAGRRARRLADQGSWSSARVPAGWLGSTGRSRCAHRSPAGASWAGCRCDARPWGWTGRR